MLEAILCRGINVRLVAIRRSALQPPQLGEKNYQTAKYMLQSNEFNSDKGEINFTCYLCLCVCMYLCTEMCIH